MTAIISAKDKAHSLDLISQVIEQFMSVGLNHIQRNNLRLHLAWMRKQWTDMNVNCRLETVPELQLTRITLEVGFAAIKPMETKQ